jgi:hypothetical protein
MLFITQQRKKRADLKQDDYGTALQRPGILFLHCGEAFRLTTEA